MHLSFALKSICGQGQYPRLTSLECFLSDKGKVFKRNIYQLSSIHLNLAKCETVPTGLTFDCAYRQAALSLGL